MKLVFSNDNSFLILTYEWKIEVWGESAEAEGRMGIPFSPDLQISSQPLSITSEMLRTLNHMEAMLVTFFTLVFVTLNNSYVMPLYMLLFRLDKVPKHVRRKTTVELVKLKWQAYTEHWSLFGMGLLAGV